VVGIEDQRGKWGLELWKKQSLGVKKSAVTWKPKPAEVWDKYPKTFKSYLSICHGDDS